MYCVNDYVRRRFLKIRRQKKRKIEGKKSKVKGKRKAKIKKEMQTVK